MSSDTCRGCFDKEIGRSLRVEAEPVKVMGFSPHCRRCCQHWQRSRRCCCLMPEQIHQMIFQCYNLPGLASDRIGISNMIRGIRKLNIGVSEFGIVRPMSIACCSGLMDLDYRDHHSCQGEYQGEKTDDGFNSGGSGLDWCGPTRAYCVVHGRVGG